MAQPKYSQARVFASLNSASSKPVFTSNLSIVSVILRPVIGYGCHLIREPGSDSG